MTFASFFSLAINSSTLSTKTPPALSAGLSTFSIFSLGVTFIPRSVKLIVSTGFFFALMIFWTLANLGEFSLRSTEKIAGKDTWIY